MTPPLDRPPRSPAASGHRRAAIWRWSLILAVALGVRLALTTLVAPSQRMPDAVEYDALARLLLDHGTYGTHTLRAPGYPTFVALVYLVFGKSLVALRVVEALVGTAMVGLLGLLGTRLFSRAAGVLTAAIAALHPVLAWLPSQEYTENLQATVIVLALIAAFSALRRGGGWRWAACGALLGLGLLIRPNSVAMLPGLGIGLAAALFRRRRGWVAPALIAGLAMALVIAPWVIRNHIVFHRWYFIATGGGRQFYFGNNPWTDGSTRMRPAIDPAVQQELWRLPDEPAQERRLYELGWQFIREHPARGAWLYLMHMRNLFALVPDTVNRTFITPWSQAAQAIASLAVFAGALLSLRRWRSEPALWPLAGSIVTFSLANAMVFASMRYRMVVEPCLILMAGLGWAGVPGLAPLVAADETGGSPSAGVVPAGEPGSG